MTSDLCVTLAGTSAWDLTAGSCVWSSLSKKGPLVMKSSTCGTGYSSSILSDDSLSMPGLLSWLVFSPLGPRSQFPADLDLRIFSVLHR